MNGEGVAVAVHRAAVAPPKGGRLAAAWASAAGTVAEWAGKSLRTLPGYAAIVTSVVGAAEVWHPLAWFVATGWLILIDRKMP